MKMYDVLIIRFYLLISLLIVEESNFYFLNFFNLTHCNVKLK